MRQKKISGEKIPNIRVFKFEFFHYYYLAISSIPCLLLTQVQLNDELSPTKMGMQRRKMQKRTNGQQQKENHTIQILFENSSQLLIFLKKSVLFFIKS